jgi:16S rRNA (guanine527-N7)-methyltransferase
MNKLLIDGLVALGIEPADDIVVSFITYLHELMKWNRAYNLTALKKDQDIIIKHFLDSLLYLKAVPDSARSVCDIGSGAGFPGAPIAVVRPDLNITLIEPSRKKAAFLRHIKRTLLLNNVDVFEQRVEDVEEGLFDVAMTRALFSVHDMIKKAGHVLKKGGLFILNKGPKFEEELKGLPAGVKCEILTVSLPLTSLKRHIVKVTQD